MTEYEMGPAGDRERSRERDRDESREQSRRDRDEWFLEWLRGNFVRIEAAMVKIERKVDETRIDLVADLHRRLEGKADAARLALLERVVYSACGLVLAAFLVAVIGMVIINRPSTPPIDGKPPTAQESRR